MLTRKRTTTRGRAVRLAGQVGGREPATSTTRRRQGLGILEAPSRKVLSPLGGDLGLRLSPGGEIVGEEDSGRLLKVKGCTFPAQWGPPCGVKASAMHNKHSFAQDLTRGCRTCHHGQRCLHPETGMARSLALRPHGDAARHCRHRCLLENRASIFWEEDTSQKNT